MTEKYTIDDAGCYVDSARGIYATDAVVELAEAHGMAYIDACDPGKDGHTDCQDAYFPSRFAGCEWAGDCEDEADDYMNAHYGVDGAYWGRNDNGDWGLWTIEDDE
jgi:hypothetical protein